MKIKAIMPGGHETAKRALAVRGDGFSHLDELRGAHATRAKLERSERVLHVRISVPCDV